MSEPRRIIEPPTVAEELDRRLADDHAHGNHCAVAVSINGGEPTYGQIALEVERYGTGWDGDDYVRKSWTVAVEVDNPLIVMAGQRVNLRMGKTTAQLNTTGIAYPTRAEAKDPYGSPSVLIATFVGSGALEQVT